MDIWTPPQTRAGARAIRSRRGFNLKTGTDACSRRLSLPFQASSHHHLVGVFACLPLPGIPPAPILQELQYTSSELPTVPYFECNRQLMKDEIGANCRVHRRFLNNVRRRTSPRWQCQWVLISLWPSSVSDIHLHRMVVNVIGKYTPWVL